MTQPQEVIRREKLVQFWDGLDPETQAELKAAVNDETALPPKFIGILAPVMGGAATKWGPGSQVDVWVAPQLREFIASLPDA